jgi:hypothetical protein
MIDNKIIAIEISVTNAGERIGPLVGPGDGVGCNDNGVGDGVVIGADGVLAGGVVGPSGGIVENGGLVG